MAGTRVPGAAAGLNGGGRWGLAPRAPPPGAPLAPLGERGGGPREFAPSPPPRKKSGEVFWASLSLSPLCDGAGQPVGLIGYLNDVTQRKDAEQRIHHLAYYDALTGLPNRTLLMKLVDQGLAAAQRRRTRASILFVDLNRVKLINDTLGHSPRARLLHQTARRFPSG